MQENSQLKAPRLQVDNDAAHNSFQRPTPSVHARHSMTVGIYITLSLYCAFRLLFKQRTPLKRALPEVHSSLESWVCRVLGVSALVTLNTVRVRGGG